MLTSQAAVRQLPGVLALEGVQGDSFAWLIKIRLDLTGYLFRCQFRNNTSMVLAELTTANGRLVPSMVINTGLSTLETHLQIALLKTETELFPLKSQYDIEWESPSGEIRTILTGYAVFQQQATYGF
jgi:hypothetical protein